MHIGSGGLIILDAVEEFSGMIFPCPGKILESQTILDGNDNPPCALLCVRKNLLQFRAEGILRIDIMTEVFKNPDKKNIVVVVRKSRLDVRKVADMNRHIVPPAVPVCIDERALFRKVNAVDAAYLRCNGARDGSRAGADFKHLLCSVEGNPARDVPAETGEMIQRRPVLSLQDLGRVILRCILLYDFQDLILDAAVAVEIFAGIL